MDVSECLNINQRLNFDEMSCDEEDEDSQSDAGSGATGSTNNSGLLRKKLNFDFVDGLDYHVDNDDEYYEEDEAERNLSQNLMGMPTNKRLRFCLNTSGASGDGLSLPSTPNSVSSGFSPCRTRSGRIYIAASSSVEKPLRMENPRAMVHEEDKSSCSKEILPKESESMTEPTRLPTPTFNQPASREKELNLLQKSLPKFDEPSRPPPLNYSKRPVSRIQPRLFESPNSDPIMISPPTNEVKAMKLFDDSQLITSPVTAPRLHMRSRIFSNAQFDENRRCSAPAPASNILAYAASNQDQAIMNDQLRKRKRSSNINPFTPTSIMATLRKKARMTSGESATDSNNGSFESYPLDMQNFASATCTNDIFDETVVESVPPKRLKVSDINISRYEEEFLELREIASGTFGTVKVARHRLDGMVYAIKITRNKIHGNTHEEKVAMNEVFAHSALIKHKHVVRYYNSWVENGRVYIQNEYCEGGSLAAKIQEFRNSGKKFTEAELKRILLHLSKGLDYIHSKLLVHLDVKPENIFISLDYPMRISEHSSNQTSPNIPENPTKVINNENMKNKKEATSTEEEIFSGNESTDSGHHSGTAKKSVKTDSNSSSPVDDRVAYKIGDLGHVAPIHGDSIPEEGDCRYMAPELLEHVINRELLAKADIFSLGLTLFEAASLKELPKNSLEDLEYEKLKSGQLPYLDGYSKDFNNLLKAMVNPDPFARPSASKLASLQSLRGTNSSNNKSRSQLYQELKETKAKLRLLEQQLGKFTLNLLFFYVF